MEKRSDVGDRYTWMEAEAEKLLHPFSMDMLDVLKEERSIACQTMNREAFHSMNMILLALFLSSVKDWFQ
jgi:hypothetical protein